MLVAETIFFFIIHDSTKFISKMTTNNENAIPFFHHEMMRVVSGKKIICE